MANVQIITMFPLTPMEVSWEEHNENGELVSRSNAILFLDFNRERVFDQNGRLESTALEERILEVVREEKSEPHNFLSEEEIAAVINAQQKESQHARTLKL